MLHIVGFWRPYESHGYLGQWYPSVFKDTTEVVYCCAEQYMMAEKAKLFNDGATRQKILKTQDPKVIKALGRRVAGFKQEVWDQYKFEIVIQANMFKFSQNTEFKERLLATGDALLVELSPLDKIWGVGTTSPDPAQWQGQNLLGKALMEVRDRLRIQQQNKLR